ncbi:MAG: hypothetical protein AAGC67_20935 [Myxococcota bacterium]
MPQRTLLIGAGLLLVGIVGFFARPATERETDARTPVPVSTSRPALPVEAPEATRGFVPGDVDTPDASRRAEDEIEAARSALAAARETLRTAELELDDLEREIEAVEKFVADIEARGDDPARHAFEGMDRLNPIIAKYEARLATLEEAERTVAAAEARLENARAGLTDRPTRAIVPDAPR